MHRMDRAHGVAFSVSDSCSPLLPAEPSRGSPLGPAALRKRTIQSGFFQHLPDSFRQRGEWQPLCFATAVTLPLRMGSRILHAEVWLLSHLLMLAALTAKTMHNPSFFLFSTPRGKPCSVSLIPLPREAGRQARLTSLSHETSKGVVPNFCTKKPTVIEASETEDVN